MARIVKEEDTLKKVVGGLERESSFLDRIWLYEIRIGAGVLAVGLAVAGFNGNWWLAGIGGALLFLGLSHRMKRGENTADIGRFQSGAAGESRVSDLLEKGLPDSYLVINDVTVRAGTKKAQNDHVVLGPNGIFVIETKAYSGTLTGKASDEYLEQVKEFKGKRTEARIKNPVPQNEYHLRVVKDRMAEGGFASDDVFSVVVFTNRYARIRIEESPVPLVKPEMLCVTIAGTASKYSYDEEWLMNLARFLVPGLGSTAAATPSPGGKGTTTGLSPG